MGWKKVKEGFGINALMLMDESERLVIQSLFGKDRIVIESGKVHEANLKEKDAELVRCLSEFESCPNLLLTLFESEDEFVGIKKVFLFEDGKLYEEECEEVGWPNSTCSGKIMVDGNHAESKADALRLMSETMMAELIEDFEKVERAEECLLEKRLKLDESVKKIKRMRRDYPEISNMEKKEMEWI